MKKKPGIRPLTLLAALAAVVAPLSAAAGLTINVDIDHGDTYSGTAVAPDSGTVWNSLSVSDSPVSRTISDISDSQGNTLSGVDVTIASSDGVSTINRYAADSPSVPNPYELMRDYTFSGTYDVTVTGLSAGTYEFWFFGHGDQYSQAGGVTVDAANGGGGGTTANSSLGRDLVNGGDGVSYVYVGGVTVDGSGTFAFQVDNYFNGFQLAAASEIPVITGLDNQAAVVGDDVLLSPAVTGTSPFTYEWRENGAAIPGETNATLNLMNVQLSQDGYVYALVAGNVHGSATNSMLLTVTEVSPGVEMTLNVDIDKGSPYSGTAAAPDSGTWWNIFSSLGTLGAGSVKDSSGSTASGVAISFTAGSLSTWSNSGNGTPNPLGLMSDYAYGRTYAFDVTGLNPGQMFALYTYAHGDNDNQTSTVTLDGANGGGSGSTAQTGDSADFRNIDVWGEGYNWVKLLGTVDGSGDVSFTAGSYVNGFQLQLLASPVISGLTNQTVVAGTSVVLSPAVSGTPPLSYQWLSNSIPIAAETGATLSLDNVGYGQDGTVYALQVSNDAGSMTRSMTMSVIVTPEITGLNNQAVAPGTTVTMTPSVSGVPAPDLQWFYNGGILSDGPTGNGSTVSGSTSDALSITGVQVADSGTYALVAGNSAGVVTNSMSLTVSASDVPPQITGPFDQTVVQGSDAVFSASAAGLPLPALQWSLNDAAIPGATNETLTVSSVQYAQDGDVYSLVASNAAGTASGSAVLYVQVPPSISEQPADLTVISGGSAEFSVVADGVPAVSYQWSRDGEPIAGATNAVFSIASVQGSDNGAVFSVEVANSVDNLTSAGATLTVLSTMGGTLLPADGSTGIAPDQQLRIVFSGGDAELGSGMLYVRDASDDSLFATIDTGDFVTFMNDDYVVTNGAIRSLQGRNCYYEPIALDENVAWITLDSDERFAYGKTYYVTFDTGLFRDATGASYPGISDPSVWQFSTKASGPGVPTTTSGPTTITVGLDGSGDFATLQGASDWIPRNNSLNRTIRIEPGFYRDYALFDQDRDNVTIIGTGADRGDVYLYYPYPTDSGNGIGVLTLASSDITVRNVDLDTRAYVNFPGRMRSLITTDDRLVFENVLIRGGQDTIYARSGIVYFNNCEIWGSVDFVYGAALTVFDACTIVQVRSSGGPIGAPNTDRSSPYGEVFLNCAFPRARVADGYPHDVGVGTTTFMRAWGKDGMLAAINCELGAHFSTVGWSDSWDSEPTCRAREYGNYGPGAATVAERQAAGAYWLNTIDPDYVANPSLPSTDPSLNPPTGHLNRIPVTVDPADYTIEAIFGHPYYGLGSWRPTDMLANPPQVLSHPAGRAVAPGSSVSLSVEASTSTGVTNYLWQVDSGSITAGNVSGIGSDMLTITGFQAGNAGSYHVVVLDGVSSTNSSAALLTLAAAPAMVSEGITNGQLSVQVPTEWGPSYVVQTNADLMSTNWQVAEIIPGDGSIHSFVTAVTNGPELFVRVKVQ